MRWSCKPPEQLAALSSDADADGNKRTIEADIFRFAFVDAAVHRAEEKVGAIAKRDLRTGRLPRHARKSAKVGNGYILVARCSATRTCYAQIVDPVFIVVRRLMFFIHALTTEQKRSVYAPIQCDAAGRRIAEQIRGGIPGNRRSNAVETPRRVEFRPEDVIKSGAVYICWLRLNFNVGA